MSRHPHLRPDPDDAAGRVNEEGLAHDAHKFATVQRFLAPGPIGREHRFGFVGSKGYGEFMFGLEFVLCAHGSAETPRIAVPVLANSERRRENATASLVQPGVSALG